MGLKGTEQEGGGNHRQGIQEIRIRPARCRRRRRRCDTIYISRSPIKKQAKKRRRRRDALVENGPFNLV